MQVNFDVEQFDILMTEVIKAALNLQDEKNENRFAEYSIAEEKFNDYTDLFSISDNRQMMLAFRCLVEQCAWLRYGNQKSQDVRAEGLSGFADSIIDAIEIEYGNVSVTVDEEESVPAEND